MPVRTKIEFIPVMYEYLPTKKVTVVIGFQEKVSIMPIPVVERYSPNTILQIKPLPVGDSYTVSETVSIMPIPASDSYSVSESISITVS
jgi:hypothetical protein